MDENTSDNDTDNKNLCDNNQPSKRIKINPDPSTVTEKTEDNVSNGIESSNSASTSNENSSPNTRPRNKNYRNRNNRNSNIEESANESGEEELQNDENTNDSLIESVGSSVSSTSRDFTLPRSTIFPEIYNLSDSESEVEHLTVLQKPKPKHSWHIVPEILKRQFGYSSKLGSAELFRNQCYGSLHCVQRLELMYKLVEHYGCVNSLNFHPDGSLLASGSDDMYIAVWDWKLGKCLFKYATKHRSNVFQSRFLHISGDLRIASCSRDGQVRVACISNDGNVRENRKLGSHQGACHKLTVFADQPQIILSAGEDGVVLRHDTRETKSQQIVHIKEDGEEIPLYSIHGHPIKTNEFCVGGEDMVRVYDQRKASSTLSTYHPFKANDSMKYQGIHVTSAVYNYNGEEILASYNDADIYLFDINSKPGEFIHRYEGHRNGATIKGVNFFGPKSEFIVSGSDCGNIFFWEKNTEAIVQCMLGDDTGVVNCLEPHPKLPFISTSGLDWDVKIWVPSCETEPDLTSLPSIVKKNKRAGSSSGGMIGHAPILWMLWQHLRSGRNARRERREYGQLSVGSSSDGSTGLDSNDTDADSDDSEEDEEVDNDDDDDENEDDDSDALHFSSECTTS